LSFGGVGLKSYFFLI